MAQGSNCFSSQDAAKLIFEDAGKNISELKKRQWDTSNLTVLIYAGLYSLSSNAKLKLFVLVASIGLLGIYVLIMWKCSRNLGVFKDRFKLVIQKYFPDEVADLYGSPEWSKAVVDEGTIIHAFYVVVGVSCLTVSYLALH